MRKWGIAAAAVVALLLSAVAIAALNLNRILATQRPRIQSELSRVLAREVSFGELAISFRDGLGVEVSDLRIGEDPAFGKEDFVSAGEVVARAALWPALFGDLQIAQVRLVAPSVRLVRSARGLSVDSLGGEKTAAPAKPSEDTGDSPGLALALANVSIENGSFRYVDFTSRPKADYEVQQLQFSAGNLSLVRPTAFELEAALLGSKAVNLWLEGELGPLEPAAPGGTQVDLALRLDPVTFEQLRAIPALASALPRELLAEGPVRVDASAKGSGSALAIRATLDAAKARVRYLPALDKEPGEALRFVFEGEKQGNDLRIDRADLLLGKTELATTGRVENLDRPTIHFSSKAPRLVAAEFGLDSASARSPEELRDVTLEGTIATQGSSPAIEARLRSPSGSLRNTDYQKLDARVALRDQRAAIESVALETFGGKLQGRGSYDMSRPEKPGFEMAWDMAGVRLEELVATQTRIGAKFIEGDLSTDLKVRGSGSNWDEIKPVLTGLGNARINGGVLRNVNLADRTLESLTGVPGLTNMLSPKLRDRYKGLLSSADTAFENLSGVLEIHDGAIHLPEIALRAAEYGIRAKGRLTLDAALDLDATLIASEGLSLALLEEAKPVKYLIGKSGKLEVPLRIHGGLPVFKITPDTKFVTQVLQRAVVGGAVDKLLGEAAKRAPAVGGAEGGTAGTPPAPSVAQDPAVAIEQGLRGLLGKKKKKKGAAVEAETAPGVPSEGSPAPAPAEESSQAPAAAEPEPEVAP